MAENPGFLALTRARVASYWDCYHRYPYLHLADYPGTRIIRFLESSACQGVSTHAHALRSFLSGTTSSEPSSPSKRIFPTPRESSTLAREAWEGPTGGRLREYFDHCLEADQIFLEEGEEPWLDFINEREPDLADVIDSKDWRLVQEDGTSERITGPLFYLDGTLGWRWNPAGPARNTLTPGRVDGLQSRRLKARAGSPGISRAPATTRHQNPRLLGT